MYFGNFVEATSRLVYHLLFSRGKPLWT